MPICKLKTGYFGVNYIYYSFIPSKVLPLFPIRIGQLYVKLHILNNTLQRLKINDTRDYTCRRKKGISHIKIEPNKQTH